MRSHVLGQRRALQAICLAGEEVGDLPYPVEGAAGEVEEAAWWRCRGSPISFLGYCSSDDGR